MSTTTQNEALARRFVNEVLAAGNRSTFDELVAADVVVDSGLEPMRTIRGREAYWTALQKLQAFTFHDFDLQDLMAVEDRVIVRFRSHATHTGDQLGVKATGKRILMWEVHLMRWLNGRLVENCVSDVNYDWPWLIASAYPDGIGRTGEG